MTIKEIYIARHGYRSNWLPPPHPPNPTGINSDPPLAPHGVEQAKQLAAYLTSLPTNDKPQFILTSPFYRCVETAQPIAQLLNLKIGLERGIGEWFKKDRKIVPKPANYVDLIRFFPDVLVNEEQWPRDRLGVIPNVEGETNEEILQRAELFWNKFIPFFEEHYPEIENILLITHAATKIALGSALLKLESVTTPVNEDKDMLRAGACSLSKYARVGMKDNISWKLTMNGNCEFLTKGEEMNWDFTIGVEAGSAEDIARRKKEEVAKEAENVENSESSSYNEKPITNFATGNVTDVKDDEYETFYITLDLPNVIKKVDDDEGAAKSRHKRPPRSKANILKPSAKLQMTDLIQEHPLIKISNNLGVNEPSFNGDFENGNKKNSLIDYSALFNEKIFETEWNELIGSELLFDEYGELIGQVKEHLTCDNSVNYTLKKEALRAVDNIEIDGLSDIEDDLRGDASTKHRITRSRFWKQSVSNAKE